MCPPPAVRGPKGRRWVGGAARWSWVVPGGIRSGKSGLAEAMVTGARAVAGRPVIGPRAVTYVATARRDPADAELAARTG